MKQEVLIIRIDEAQKNKLSKMAKDSNRTMSDFVRLLVDLAVKNKTKV